jgi:Rod binding domain-containing protein
MHLAKLAMQEMPLQGSPIGKDPRLERSAHEFEASLMAELLKPLQQTDGLTGEDSDGGGAGSGGALGDFASESLARAISERGGFGIADRILRQLNAVSPGKPKTDATGHVSSGLKVSGKPPI